MAHIDLPIPQVRLSVVSLRRVVASSVQSTTHSHYGKVLLTDSEEAVDSAQTSALNFAEVLAPLLLAASNLDDSRRDHDEMERHLDLLERATISLDRLERREEITRSIKWSY